jgi:F-box/leucine-rich repeat protein 2/20
MLVKSCPIRDLILCGANFFDDEGMKTLSSAKYLDTLELMDCVAVTDAGMRLLAHTPRLINLTLRQCDHFTDDGVGEVVRAQKLESLIVEGGSRVSAKTVLGAAKSVHYKDDYPGYLGLDRV